MKERRMQAQAGKFAPQYGKFSQAVIWIAGIALTLFCGVGIAALMGWIPSAIGGPNGKAAFGRQSVNTPSPAALMAHRAAASLPAWNTGDKVKLINGAIQSNA